ncbi:hypothetical protein GCM10010359_28750 [Streptomyces morookaense]|nr:hypothetical protein GCM10010359_28750 [Streptomyces morookaense]
MEERGLARCNWIQWAGGSRRLIPRGRRYGPGGGQRLPDCHIAGLSGICRTSVRAWACGVPGVLARLCTAAIALRRTAVGAAPVPPVEALARVRPPESPISGRPDFGRIQPWRAFEDTRVRVRGAARSRGSMARAQP